MLVRNKTLAFIFRHLRSGQWFFWSGLWLCLWFLFPVKPFLSYDNHSIAMQPITIMNGEGFDLSRFRESDQFREAVHAADYEPGKTYILLSQTGLMIGNFPIFSALVMLPFYALYSLFRPDLWQATTFAPIVWSANYFVATSFTVIAAWFWAKILRGYGLKWPLIGLVILVGVFGTPVISVSSRFVWQHTTALACISMAIWAFQQRRGGLFLFLATVTVLCRPATALILFPVLIFYGLESWKKLQLANKQNLEPYWSSAYFRYVGGQAWRSFTIESTSTGLSWLLFSLVCWGIQIDYANIYLGKWFGFAPQYDRVRFHLQQLWLGLVGQLFSPGRGLFFYSPMFLLSLVWWVKLRRREFCWLIGLVLYHLICGMWDMWHGGWSLSYRLVMDGLPMYVIGLGLFWYRFRRNAWLRILLGILVGLAVFYHAVIGVFWGDCAYNAWPGDIDTLDDAVMHQRIWNDSPILRCVDLWKREGFQPRIN